ncbi:MAG TPA: substrate-binding domain-containing protein, partial [Ilumatobacteraceae bacterium]|nr:substrate-binding domain-containing protein [Ilumatobacteraceae bacterium]
MRTSTRLIVSIAAACGLLVSACGSDDKAAETTTTTAAPTSTSAAPTTTAAATTTSAAATTTEAPEPAVEGDITVFAAASLTAAYTEIGEAFMTEYPDAEVVFNFAASSELVAQITEGAPA